MWEPLEKPVFAGWDMWVTLSESGRRRRDAEKLLQVLSYLGASKPTFTREVRYIRLARKVAYRYAEVESAWAPSGGPQYIYYPLKGLFNRTLTREVYTSMPDDLKPYFNRSTKHHWNGSEYYEYHLDWKFPVYELILRCKKSYNNFIGHLYGDEIGEYNRLNRWLWHEAQIKPYKALYGHVGYKKWYEKKYQKGGCRSRWNAACKELKYCPNWMDEVLTDGEVNADDFVTDIERRYRLHSVLKYD